MPSRSRGAAPDDAGKPGVEPSFVKHPNSTRAPNYLNFGFYILGSFDSDSNTSGSKCSWAFCRLNNVLQTDSFFDSTHPPTLFTPPACWSSVLPWWILCHWIASQHLDLLHCCMVFCSWLVFLRGPCCSIFAGRWARFWSVLLESSHMDSHFQQTLMQNQDICHPPLKSVL